MASDSSKHLNWKYLYPVPWIPSVSNAFDTIGIQRLGYHLYPMPWIPSVSNALDTDASKLLMLVTSRGPCRRYCQYMHG